MQTCNSSSRRRMLLRGMLTVMFMLLAASAGPGLRAQIVIDDFNTGAFSTSGLIDNLPASGAIGGMRDVHVQDSGTPTTPSVMSLTTGNGYLDLTVGNLPGTYSIGWGYLLFGGATNLNFDASSYDRVVVTLSQAPSSGLMFVTFERPDFPSFTSTVTLPLTGAGDYTFLFSSFSGIDPSDIDAISLVFSAGVPAGSTIRVESIATGPPVPNLSIDDVSVNEGDAATTTFDFTVSLNLPAGAGGVTFDIATADGTAQDDNPATEDNDYVALALTGQSIAAGNSSKMFSVTVNGDLAIESNETFFVNVSNVIGATLGDGQGLGTITNDDVASPEMDVQGNGISIADGDNSPDTGDNTDFGSADVTSGTVSRSFTLHNTSGPDLNLTGTPPDKVEIGGADAGDFTVTLQPSSPVPTGNFTIFSIQFNPSAPGSRTATVSIDNNDSDEHPYNFAIQGTGTTPNTAPVNAVPGPQATNENTPLVFSSGNGNPISISDVDAGGAQVRVTLTATNGTLTLSAITGLTFITGDGTADATMTFIGTISDINAALNGLSFAPTANFNGPASLQIVTNDQGNTGSGGPLSDDDTVNITVTAPVKAFVFLANKVTLKRTKQDTPEGDIHSNGTLTVEKGDPSTYESNLTAVGKITIQKDNTINGDVTSQTSISNSGTINGTPSVGTVANEPLPSLSYSAGGANKTVPNGGSLTVAPGSYGIVTINSGGTLKLASGEYFMTELRALSSETVIEIDLTSGDEAVINVESNLQLGKEAAIQLLPNGEGDSEKVTFNTLQSTAVNLGKEAYLLGSFNAPNAKVTLVKNSQLRGSICAKEILVERDCLFLHHDATSSLPGPGDLPKSSFDEEEEASDQSTVISYQLEQNYPNPFNPSTVISFALPIAGEVSLSIFNTNGQLVKKFVAGEMNAGQHSFTWDATNERGERVASGVYLYVIKAAEFTAQRKLVLMK